MKIILFFIFLVFVISFYFLNDTRKNYPVGYGYTDGNEVSLEIGRDNFVRVKRGDLVRVGETIKIYDHNDGEHKNVVVESIERHEFYFIVVIFNLNTGDIRTLEINKDWMADY